MRILFVSTNRLKKIMPPMPLGLASVIAQIDESRHEIQVLDLMFAEQPEVELKARLAGFSPGNQGDAPGADRARSSVHARRLCQRPDLQGAQW